MSEDSGSYDGISWQSKLKISVAYPSSIFGDVPSYKSVWEIETITIDRNKEQRTINTISGARRGFITIEGDLEGSFTVLETDSTIHNIESLAESNDYFDVVLTEYKPGKQDNPETSVPDGPDEWKIKKILAAGVKFESISTTYEFGEVPKREYTWKFLRHEITTAKKPNDPMDEGDGLYWDVTVDFE